MGFSTQKGWYGDKKAKNVRNNQGYPGRNSYWRRRRKNEIKNKSKKRRQLIKTAVESILFVGILGLIMYGFYYFSK